MRQTVEYEEFTELLQHENTYSVEELKLLLFRWDICFQTEYQRTDEELLALLKCCNQDKYVDVEQVKVFPCSLLVGTNLQLGGGTETIRSICEKICFTIGKYRKSVFLKRNTDSLQRYS